MIAKPDSDWTSTTIRDLETAGDIELGRGQIISKKDIEANPGDYPVYSSSARGDGEFGRYGMFMFDEELVTWSVDGGGKFFYRPKRKFSITNVSGFLRIKAKDKLDAYYTWAHLFSIWQTMTFNYTEKLHPSILRERFSFSYPHITEQRKIAGVLGLVQRAMEQQERLLTRTTELKKAFLHHLFTHGLRHEPQKPTDLGPIPKSWDATRLGDVADLINGFAFKSEDYVPDGVLNFRVVNIREHGVIDTSSDVEFLPKEFMESHRQYLLSEGDILVVMVGATRGKMGYVPRSVLPALMNQNMWRIVPNSPNAIHRRYLYHYLTIAVPKFVREFSESARGFFKKSDFRTILIPKPPFDEQREVAEAIDNVEQKMELHRRTHAALSDVFRTLLHELMTARIRVHNLDLPELESAVK